MKRQKKKWLHAAFSDIWCRICSRKSKCWVSEAAIIIHKGAWGVLYIVNTACLILWLSPLYWSQIEVKTTVPQFGFAVHCKSFVIKSWLPSSLNLSALKKKRKAYKRSHCCHHFLITQRIQQEYNHSERKFLISLWKTTEFCVKK